MPVIAGLRRASFDVESLCRRMLSAQVPGFDSVWSEGDVALGAASVRRSADGRYVAIADIRIDNRSELASALGLADAELRRSEVVDLLLLSWVRWGEACMERILGDFAFALWSEPTEELVLARDFLGFRPLFFAGEHHNWAFASMPKGLFGLATACPRPDRKSLTSFLSWQALDPGRSFYRDINRVDPGEIVRLSRAGIHRRRYWKPDLQPLHSDDRSFYVEAVRESLKQAVQARLNDAGEIVATQLSGGLDSSAVTAFAAREMAERGRLIAMTLVPDRDFPPPVHHNLYWNEGPAAAQVAAMYPNIDHIRVEGVQAPTIALWDAHVRTFQAPAANPIALPWLRAMDEAAVAQGANVLLLGQFGNLTFSHEGWELLPEAFSRVRWLRLAREIGHLRGNGSSLRNLLAQAIGPTLPRIGFQRRHWQAIDHYTLLRDPEPFRSAHLQPRRPRDARQRVEEMLSLDPGTIFKGVRIGWGIEWRDPTADRRLVELCLRIPADQYLVHGVPRALARDVLQGLVPDPVRSERRRGYQAADWNMRWHGARHVFSEEVARFRAYPDIYDLLDIERMERLIDAWPRGTMMGAAEQTYRFTLTRALSAGHFMRTVLDGGL